MNILKELRKSKGITQAELCKEIKIAQPTLSGYEKGLHEPDMQTLKKLAKYFDVTIDHLLGWDKLTPEERAAGASLTRKVDITPQEDELLALFRKLSPYLKDLTLHAVRSWAEGTGTPGSKDLQKKA